MTKWPLQALPRIVAHEKMASLEQVNELARGVTDFQMQSFDGSKLLIIGSFDLC